MRGLFLAEIAHGIVEQGLAFLSADILENIVLVSLRVRHLTQYLSVWRDDTLDSIVRTIGVCRRLHGRLQSNGVGITERHLPIAEQLGCQCLRHNKLTLAMADGYRVCVALLHIAQPRAVGGSDDGRYHLRYVAIDVVAEESRRLRGNTACLAIGQKTALDKCLETIA